MEDWQPEVVFLLTGFLAGLGGTAAEARLQKTLTMWQAITACVFYGLAGTAFGMMGYRWMGGKEHPETILACGIMVGLRFITPSFITTIAERLTKTSLGDKEK